MRQTSEPPHVIVIGAGVIGVACAYYLSKAGRRVTLVDKGAYGQGCSHGNCGIIAHSHVLPLAEPGAFFKTLKTLFQKNSPLSIKPRWDPRLWAWLWNFARRCNKEDMLSAARARAVLLDSSLQLYKQLLDEEALDCEWEQRGCLFVYRTRVEMDKYAKTNQLLSDEFNLPATRYDGAALLDLEPALKSACVGGWHYPSDAHLRPDKLMTAWRKILDGRGVSIREAHEVTGFSRTDDRAAGVHTTVGDLPADAFVVAAGALTPWLNKHLGCNIPIQPGKGYSITMPRPDPCPTRPILFPEHKIAVTPMHSGYRLGSMMEFAGYDTRIPPHRLQLLKESAAHYLHEPYREPVEEQWFGWRPMTFDGIPIISYAPMMKNVIVAAGHSMLGLSMAPATGKLVAEMLTGEVPHLDLSPYGISRGRKK